MAVTLIAPYQGAAAGAVVELLASEEAALVTQRRATTALATAITTGAQTSNGMAGTAAIAAGQGSVVITNPNVDANSKVWAQVAQAAADGTLLYAARVVCAAGSFTIYGNANATATTFVDWAILVPAGLKAVN
jgi:hypothetical protein